MWKCIIYICDHLQIAYCFLTANPPNEEDIFMFPSRKHCFFVCLFFCDKLFTEITFNFMNVKMTNNNNNNNKTFLAFHCLNVILPYLIIRKCLSVVKLLIYCFMQNSPVVKYRGSFHMSQRWGMCYGCQNVGYGIRIHTSIR